MKKKSCEEISLAEAAARYAAAGWPIFPLHEIRDGTCSCHAGSECAHPGKHPRTRNGHQDATTGPDVVAGWWRRWPTANLATPNGTPSGLAVIDLDGPEGAATWTALESEYGQLATATAQTPHGQHLWYRIPEGLTVPRRIRGLGPGTDLLGTGGYTLLPPSHVPCLKPDHRAAGLDCGTSYTWTDRRTLAELPGWILQQLHQREHAPAAAQYEAGQSQRLNYAQAALAGEVVRVTNAPRGSQNDTLNYAAWRLGQLVSTRRPRPSPHRPPPSRPRLRPHHPRRPRPKPPAPSTPASPPASNTPAPAINDRTRHAVDRFDLTGSPSSVRPHITFCRPRGLAVTTYSQ